MTFRNAIVTLVLVVGAASPCVGQHVPGVSRVDPDVEQQQFRADLLRDYNSLMSAWRTALEQKDLQKAANYYSESAHARLPGGELVSGRDAIRDDLGGRLPQLIEIRTGITDFVASSRLAYALGPYWYQYRAADGSMASVTGTYLAVLVREGSRWKIRSQVFDAEPTATGTTG